MVEFGATINLTAKSATQQVNTFAKKLTDASRILKEFQFEAKKTEQGTGNIFSRYIASTKSASVQTEKMIKNITQQRLSYSKLTDEQKKLVASVDVLNRKYDEAAQRQHSLLQVRREMRQLVASGLKTQKEANAIYDREAIAINKTTKEYKLKQQQLKINNNLHTAQAKRIAELKDKYLGLGAAEKAEMKVVKELNLLRRRGLIDNKQYNRMLAEQKKRIEHVTSRTITLTSAQHKLAKAARMVSVLSRVLLGLYAVQRIGKFAKDVEETAEKIGLLQNKLEFLTGDSGAYQKLFEMTQDVGIELEAANKIITRFAVVTDKAFSIESLNEWTSTIVQSARATGTSTQEMRGALIQITQAMSAGRLMGDEYRSVTENLPLFTVALRELFGKSTLSLKELSSQGLLTNDVLIKGFEKLKEIIKGFPDSTDTIEAAFGRLSSAWDNFLFNIGQTNITKTIINELAHAVNVYSQALQNAKIQEETDLKVLASARAISAVESVEIEKKRIKEIEQAMSDRGDEGIVNKALNAIDEARLTSLRDKLIETTIAAKDLREEADRFYGVSKEQTSKSEYEEKVEAVKAEIKLTKEKLKLEKMLERFSSGKSISRVKKQADLNRSEIVASNLRYQEGKTGANPRQLAQGLEDIARTEEESIARIQKTKVDAALRARNLKTDFNIEDIELELAHNKKILLIEKKFAENIIEVESSKQAMLISIDKGIPEADRIGITTEKAKELLAALSAEKIKLINEELVKVGASIMKIGMAADQSRLGLELKKEQSIPRSKFEGVSEGESNIGFEQLAMDKVQATENYAKKVREVNKLIDEGKSKNTEAGDALVAIQELTLESLKKEHDARLDTLNIDYQETFDNNYIANQEAVEAIIDLWDSVGDSIITGIGDALAEVIMEQKSFADALAVTMKAVTKTVISGLVEIGIRRLIAFTTSEAMQTAQLATSTAAALTTAAAWTKAAAAVNAATFGAAAAAGALEIIKIAAVAEVAFAPKAHSGLDRNPEEGTMLLRRDEMVLDPGTSAKVRNNINGATTGGEFGGGGNAPLVIQIDAQDAESFVQRVGQPDVMNEIFDRFQEMMNEHGRSFS